MIIHYSLITSRPFPWTACRSHQSHSNYFTVTITPTHLPTYPPISRYAALDAFATQHVFRAMHSAHLTPADPCPQCHVPLCALNAQPAVFVCSGET